MTELKYYSENHLLLFSLRHSLQTLQLIYNLDKDRGTKFASEMTGKVTLCHLLFLHNVSKRLEHVK